LNQFLSDIFINYLIHLINMDNHPPPAYEVTNTGTEKQQVPMATAPHMTVEDIDVPNIIQQPPVVETTNNKTDSNGTTILKMDESLNISSSTDNRSSVRVIHKSNDSSKSDEFDDTYWALLVIMFICGVCGLVYGLRDYPDLRTDDNVKNYPWYQVATWSITSLVPIIHQFYRLIKNNGFKKFGSTTFGLMKVTLIIYAAAWIWGWIIIDDSGTWDHIKDNYRKLYDTIAAYQAMMTFTLIITLVALLDTETKI
jgi:hypothetical protein